MRRIATMAAVAAALAALVYGCAKETVPSRSDPPPLVVDGHRVLYPVSGSIVTANPALFLVIGPDAPEPPAFTLDGKPLAAVKYTFAEAWKDVLGKVSSPVGSPHLPLRSPLLKDKKGQVVWTAVAMLADGPHALALGGKALAAFSSRPPGADDLKTWTEPVLRVHNPPKNRAEALDCAKCHEADPSGDKRCLGVAPIPKTCYGCHEEVEMQLVHEHVMEFLAKCQMCHDPHAATRPWLLIDTKKKVCVMCHEEGHAK